MIADCRSPRRGRRLCALGAAAALAWSGSAALPLELPEAAERQETREDEPAIYSVATSPFGATGMATAEASGTRLREAWRIPGAAQDALALLESLAAQLAAEGQDMLLRCRDSVCGGFDFRFSRDVLPLPAMFVDLGDYLYLSAGDPEGRRLTEVLVSPSGGDLFVQINRIVPEPLRAAPAANDDAPGTPAGRASEGGAGQPVPGPADDVLAARLRDEGRLVLEGLRFDSGAATLRDIPGDLFAAIGALLRAAPGLRLAVGGHSDTTGGYAGNLALSEARAAAVVRELVTAHDAPAAQLDAHGMSYLAPRASNRSAEGRARNRRVELVWVAGDLPGDAALPP